MKKRRGSSTKRTVSAAAVATIVIGGGAAVASIILCAIVSTPSCHLIPVVVVEAASSTAIRGGGGGGGGGDNDVRHLISDKRLDDSSSKRRPAILDSHQGDKIERWKEDQQQQQQQQQGSSIIGGGGSSRQRILISNTPNINEAKEALFLRESSSVLPHLTPSGKRRLFDYIPINHKKESDYGHVSVTKVDGDEFHFQTVPPTTTSGATTTTTTSTTTTSTTTTSSTAAAANTEGPIETYDQSLGEQHPYYPIITPDHSVGTCTNNGNEPDHYSSSNGFLYDTLEACCKGWFVNAEECMVGFAISSDGLLLRDPATGVPLSESSSSSSSSSSSTTSSTTTSISSSNVVFYPSFDMTAYPDGACLNDGKQPEVYTTHGGYLFDSISACCQDWFIDELGCKEASLQAAASTTSVGVGGDETPVPSPSSDTDWPTWPTDFDYEDDDDEFDEVVVGVPEEASSTTAAAAGATSMTAQELESLSFYESFESGDFNRNDWRLTSSSPTSDLWEADQSSFAYDGFYAARPGVLSEPNSQSNLTIVLDDIQSVRHGGYLTFAIHASVAYPVDVLLFAINDNVIRTFDEVTGDEGEWEEVSLLLNAGVHQLTWSYQYFGETTSALVVDPRRGGNSWVDAIKLRPFTGDVTIADDDDGTTLTLTNGMTPFELLPDVDAYDGSKSYVAYTEAIDASQGSAEMSWEVYIGPSGGVISFAVFASLYAPHDVCEFSIDGVPQVVIATPSDDWEVHHVAVDAGKHELKWKLIKNVSGLNTDIINDVDVPSEYQGYVKVDGINLEDNSVTHDVHEEAPVADVDEEEVDEEVLVAAAEEVSDTTTTTTTAATTTTTTTVAPTSTEEPVTTTSTTSTTEATTTEEPTTTEKPTTTEEPTTTSTTEQPSATTKTNTEFDECPSNLFAVEGLPGCCVEEPSYLGDGACDPRAPYNTEACAFDLGDCCHETCNPDSAYGCFTKEGGEYGPFGFFCIDPRFGNIDANKCQVENLEWIGDGGCDTEGGYNTLECGWDGGDCCEETCDSEYSFYPCGENQPYTCLDPTVSTNTTESDSSDSTNTTESDSSDSTNTTESVPSVSTNTTESDPSVSTNTTESDPSVSTDTRSDSPFEFHDGFESGVFDPLNWDVDDGDAKWKIEDSETAVEGNYYAAARSGDISPEFGTANLKHGIESIGGGVLSFDIQALVQIPFDDVIIMVDDDIVAEFTSATAGWERKTLDITAGPHMVQWIHRKNPSNMGETDLAAFGDPDEGVTMVDNVAFQLS